MGHGHTVVLGLLHECVIGACSYVDLTMICPDNSFLFHGSGPMLCHRVTANKLILFLQSRLVPQDPPAPLAFVIFRAMRAS
jgi:hypothetical protein